MPQAVDELISTAILCLAMLAALGACYLAIFVLQSLDHRYPVPLFDSALRRLRAPALLFTPVLAASLAMVFVDVGPWLHEQINHTLLLLTIVGVAWSSIRLFDIWRDTLSRRFRMDVSDNLHARQVHTQVQVIRRIAVVLVSVVAQRQCVNPSSDVASDETLAGMGMLMARCVLALPAMT
jgi:hypothetical protein